MKSWVKYGISLPHIEVLLYIWGTKRDTVLFTWKVNHYWVFTLSSLCEAKEESFQASQRCQTLFSSPQLCIPWPSRLLEKLNYSNTIVSRQLSKLFTLSWSTVIFWGFTINQDKQHVMKTTPVCIKDAFQNKSFLVNTGLYVYIYHNNLSFGSKSYHFTCWDLYFTYSFSTVLILSWNSNPSNWLFTEDTHCF